MLGLCALAPLHVRAQTPTPGEPDVSQARIRVGRLILQPTIALTNLGVDTNVFNAADQAEPKRDFTLTLTPQTDLWLRLGRSWLIGNIREDLVYYQEFASERAANDRFKIGWLVPLNRLTFNAEASYLSARDRPGFEIDARSQRTERIYHGTAEVRAGGKTFVGLRADRQTTDFDSSATFDGVSLGDALNRTVDGAGITVRHQLTPLTALTLDIGRSQDRFASAQVRDSDSTNVTLGVRFDPFAIIKGGATFGYRHFAPLSSAVPDYKGATAAADLSYVALGRTRLGLQVIRDVEYSFDVQQPYYLLTGVSGSLSQQVLGPVDLVARAGIQQLNYRRSSGTTFPLPDRVDNVHTYGGGIGYRLGHRARIGFDLDQQHRASPVENRDYHALKFGTSVTYGF